MESYTTYIKISKDLPLDGSYLVLDPGHYTSMFNAWLYQLCNVPEIRQNLIQLKDEQFQDIKILVALRGVCKQMGYVDASTQIMVAKTLLMLALEQYHPESPFALLPKPILRIIIQYCTGAEGNSYVYIPPRLIHFDPTVLHHDRPAYDKLEHQREWMYQLQNQVEQYLSPILCKYIQHLKPKCNCQESSRIDPMLYLSLTIHSTIIKSLKSYFDDELLEKENRYYCSSCKVKCDALISRRLTDPPQVLFLQFNRKTFNWENMSDVWIPDSFPVDKVLDISPVVFPPPSAPVLYELCGLVLAYGRYVGCSAVIRDNKNRWIFYNLYKGYLDVELVKDLDEELKILGGAKDHNQPQFQSRDVHGLVYRRISS